MMQQRQQRGGALLLPLLLFALALCLAPTRAFMLGNKAPLPSSTTTTHRSHSHKPRPAAIQMVGYENKRLLSAVLRRDLLLASAVGVVTLAGGIPLLPKSVLAVKPAAAAEGEVGDLDAPTKEEVEAERVKAKLRRQKEAVLSKEKGGAEEQSYADSLKREQEKQKSLKKDKKQRREDLCEKLGRGC